ncbi:MAG: LysM peptidoglycan-binding domain-containing protein [Anaerolineae bacterium]|nr:LysM peptidoglycan-binding domain-containing protein [Anaerolineae bacterium]
MHIKKPLFIIILAIMLLVLSVPMASASGGAYHTVRYGETLFSIGRYYGVNPYYIAEVNNLYNPNYIYAGQVLYIPTGGYPGGHPGANHYVVRYGDTLTNIAYRYGVSPWAIAKANHIYNMNCIYAGQVLYIPTGYGCYQQPCGDGYYPSGGMPVVAPPVIVPY